MHTSFVLLNRAVFIGSTLCLLKTVPPYFESTFLTEKRHPWVFSSAFKEFRSYKCILIPCWSVLSARLIQMQRCIWVFCHETAMQLHHFIWTVGCLLWLARKRYRAEKSTYFWVLVQCVWEMVLTAILECFHHITSLSNRCV